MEVPAASLRAPSAPASDTRSQADTRAGPVPAAPAAAPKARTPTPNRAKAQRDQRLQSNLAAVQGLPPVGAARPARGAASRSTTPGRAGPSPPSSAGAVKVLPASRLPSPPGCAAAPAAPAATRAAAAALPGVPPAAAGPARGCAAPAPASGAGGSQEPRCSGVPWEGRGQGGSCLQQLAAPGRPQPQNAWGSRAASPGDAALLAPAAAAGMPYHHGQQGGEGAWVPLPLPLQQQQLHQHQGYGTPCYYQQQQGYHSSRQQAWGLPAGAPLYPGAASYGWQQQQQHQQPGPYQPHHPGGAQPFWQAPEQHQPSWSGSMADQGGFPAAHQFRPATGQGGAQYLDHSYAFPEPRQQQQQQLFSPGPGPLASSLRQHAPQAMYSAPVTPASLDHYRQTVMKTRCLTSDGAGAYAVQQGLGGTLGSSLRSLAREAALQEGPMQLSGMLSGTRDLAAFRSTAAPAGMLIQQQLLQQQQQPPRDEQRFGSTRLAPISGAAGPKGGAGAAALPQRLDLCRDGGGQQQQQQGAGGVIRAYGNLRALLGP
jgi:hypothetical protein